MPLVELDRTEINTILCGLRAMLMRVREDAAKCNFPGIQPTFQHSIECYEDMIRRLERAKGG